MIPAETWDCTLCGEHTTEWLALTNHLRLFHPDVDREVDWRATEAMLGLRHPLHGGTMSGAPTGQGPGHPRG